MKKTKKVIISLLFSLVIVLIIYFISNFKSNSEYTKIPVFKTNMLEGSVITNNDITYINVKKNSLSQEFKSTIVELEDSDKKSTSRNVYAGEFVIKTTIKEDNLKEVIYTN